MAQPDLQEMTEQTKRYRAERLDLWELLQKKRDEYVSSARQHGASEHTAQEAAARHMRGEVRVFVDELLLHLREQTAGAFVKAAPREWGVRTELLLDVDPLVPGYIAQSFPVVAWTAQIDAAEREAVRLALAQRDADWTPWLQRRLERVSEVGAGAAEHVFGAVGEVGKGLGEGIGGLGKGLGEGAGGLGKGLGEGLGDALKIAVGVLSVGAVVIGGIWILRR
jgi:hypothetical protein